MEDVFRVAKEWQKNVKQRRGKSRAKGLGVLVSRQFADAERRKKGLINRFVMIVQVNIVRIGGKMFFLKKHKFPIKLNYVHVVMNQLHIEKVIVKNALL